MKAKKSPKSPKTTLTLKQAKLLKEIPTAASIAEAGEKAGYYDRQTAHRALKGIAERAPEVLERLGLTVEFVADKCLRPLLEAKETKFFANQGIVLDTREVEALDIRLRAVDLWGRLMGAFTAQKLQVSGNLNLDLNHASDAELDNAITALLGADESPAKT